MLKENFHDSAFVKIVITQPPGNYSWTINLARFSVKFLILRYSVFAIFNFESTLQYKM